MGFNVGFSKRKEEKVYLPGQEIRISRRAITSKSYTTENDNVLTCRQRTLFAMCCFAAVYLILCARVTYVCLGNGINIDTALVEMSDDDVIRLKNTVKRADIMDRNGEIIATSLPTVNLYANTKQIRHQEDVAAVLSEIFPDDSYEYFLKRLNRKGAFIYLKRNLSPSQQSQVNNLGIPGLEFEKCEKRVYPHKNLFAHVLGSTDVDNAGISGIEKSMNDRLTNSTKPLYLSLDLGIQNQIRDELIAGVKQFNAAGGAAILMDVKTGQIVAMTSVPDYDPNENSKFGEKEMFNFATKGIYEAGSVFKVFNTALSLESGKVKPTDRFDTSHPIKVHRLKVTDPHGSHGLLTPEDILVESSNIGSTLEIMRVGKKFQRKFLQSINMDKALTEFELPELAKPWFLPENKWGETSMVTISYGYGISSTPLHIITAFSAIVNGGIYHQPTLLYNHKNKGKRIVSEKTSNSMRTMLRAVVTRGTGRRANVEGYQVMGKTGTADKLENGHYNHSKSISSFISAFPQSNPKYALLVVIDDPKASKETFGYTTAGWNAVPITKNIISAVAPQLNVKADFDLEKQKSIVDAAYKVKKQP
ncbi:MAG: penicillin-binding protein 2 [Alphaproteobacteria bacterium]|nr:penicillin-binding protein 2 [Alphaproteobacteria bacterium]